MNINLDTIKNIDPKMLGQRLLKSYKNYNVTILFLVSFFVIGFSLLRVQSLTELASRPASESTTPNGGSAEVEALTTIDLDEETLERLDNIKDDTDVIIDSNLPTNRINPF